jgi:hypothetical protein
MQYITSVNFFYTGSNNEHRIFNHTAVHRVCPFTVVASMLVWEWAYNSGRSLLTILVNHMQKLHNITWDRLVSSYQLNAQFLYSIKIYMLHYNPWHVLSSTMLIFRRTNCSITASGIVTLCKRPYSMLVESELGPLSTGILYGCLQRVTIPQAVILQFVLLKMSKVLLETCWGL